MYKQQKHEQSDQHLCCLLHMKLYTIVFISKIQVLISIHVHTGLSLIFITHDGSQMSPVMRKPSVCICENKGTDQLFGNRAADQCPCFCYIASTIPLFPISKPSSVAVQPSL